jgi:hypothetical protein
MAPSSRDRISVDLHGLKAALHARALAKGVSPSALVRSILAEALSLPAGGWVEQHQAQLGPCRGERRARLCLRMSREEAANTLSAARLAGMNPGSFVAGLAAGVPAIQSGRGRVDHVAALVASNAELSTFSRNIHHLTHLLRQGEVGPALVYREMLDTLSGDVRRHLFLASGVLAELHTRGQAPQQRRS